MPQVTASTQIDPQGLPPAGSSRTAIARAARLAGAALLAGCVTAQAQSLAELHDAARGHDAGYQSARAQYEANLAKAAQARAGLLPSASLTASASRTHTETTNSPETALNPREYGTQSAGINLSQPLYRPANLASYRQGEQQSLLAEEQLKAAEQDLIVRVAQGYFDLLGAQDSLAFVRAQKAAVAEQLASARRNFEVGTATITDTREAQARFDLVTAQEIAAENDLRVKQLALDNLTGRTGTAPWPLKAGAALPGAAETGIEQWVASAEADNPTVRQARIAHEVARLEVEKAKAGEKPTLDVVAGINRTLNHGNSSNPNAGISHVNGASIGVNFSLPLFAGFALQNRVKETLMLEDKARADLDNASRSVAQAARVAYLGVVSGLGQVKAYEAAEASSQSLLEASKLGYQVGVRVNLDVLNAQSQLFDTKAKLAKARHDLLVGGLKLRQAGGVLKGEDLQGVNALLRPAEVNPAAGN